MEKELNKYLPQENAKIIVKLTSASCSMCGSSNGLEWERAPCSKKCLKRMLEINADSEFALFPAQWLSDF